MNQWSRAYSAPAEDWNSILRTHSNSSQMNAALAPGGSMSLQAAAHNT